MVATLLLERCNPYGAETGGPVRVMGGLHGPNSARTPDMNLPLNVEQGEWSCPQQAQVRVKMTCRCGHVGRVMPLCSWHDEWTERGGGFVGGRAQAPIRELVRVRGHYEEISRRQSESCLRCLYPGRFAADYKSIEAWQGELAYLRDLGAWYSRRAAEVRGKIEDIVAGFDHGNATGEIHRCPMRLVPVS